MGAKAACSGAIVCKQPHGFRGLPLFTPPPPLSFSLTLTLVSPSFVSRPTVDLSPFPHGPHPSPSIPQGLPHPSIPLPPPSLIFTAEGPKAYPIRDAFGVHKPCKRAFLSPCPESGASRGEGRGQRNLVICRLGESELSPAPPPPPNGCFSRSPTQGEGPTPCPRPLVPMSVQWLDQ